jgi:methylated-DNA-protein-cysteine methyltransferase-like protein
MWLEQGLPIRYICFIPFPANKSTDAESSFFEKVWSVVRTIPKGHVTTYGAIAAFLGSTGSARMVGWALNACHNSEPPVPAHRVINRNGMLTGKFHFGGISAMQQLLEAEGVKVKDDVVVDFKKLFWKPK